MKKNAAKIAADRKYRKKIVQMSIGFNPEKEEELLMVEFAKSVNFSKWVKNKILEEIKKKTA
ncbi:hypothetical protein [Mannheimia indoligenes]|uniref:hypothetical protein n=1 Tax=Mannheimia indoligenes TaxID=3103145 RepID=UPI002FE591C5